jgi:hypothetical protein
MAYPWEGVWHRRYTPAPGSLMEPQQRAMMELERSLGSRWSPSPSPAPPRRGQVPTNEQLAAAAGLSIHPEPDSESDDDDEEQTEQAEQEHATGVWGSTHLG